jgi:hypothetical protein
LPRVRANALRAPVFLSSIKRKTGRRRLPHYTNLEKNPRKCCIASLIDMKFNSSSAGGTVNLNFSQIRLKLFTPSLSNHSPSYPSLSPNPQSRLLGQFDYYNKT